MSEAAVVDRRAEHELVIAKRSQRSTTRSIGCRKASARRSCSATSKA